MIFQFLLLLGYNDTNFLRVIRILFSEDDLSKALPNSNLTEQTLYFSVLIISHLYYYLLLLAIAFGIYNLFKKKQNTDLNSLILLFVCLCNFYDYDYRWFTTLQISDDYFTSPICCIIYRYEIWINKAKDCKCLAPTSNNIFIWFW